MNDSVNRWAVRSRQGNGAGNGQWQRTQPGRVLVRDSVDLSAFSGALAGTILEAVTNLVAGTILVLIPNRAIA